MVVCFQDAGGHVHLHSKGHGCDWVAQFTCVLSQLGDVDDVIELLRVPQHATDRFARGSGQFVVERREDCRSKGTGPSYSGIPWPPMTNIPCLYSTLANLRPEAIQHRH